MVDLSDLKELKRACEYVRNQPDNVDWHSELCNLLVEVSDSDFQTRASKDFQQKIWANTKPVASADQGNINVEKAVNNEVFRHWLAENSMEKLPIEQENRVAKLDEIFDQLLKKVRPHANRTPRAKAYKVMATFFPTEFTTIVSNDKLKKLHRAMFGNSRGSGPNLHANILQKLDEARGISPTDNDFDAITDRMRFPWRLYELWNKGALKIEEPVDSKALSINLPALTLICDKVSKHGHFPESVVRKLHCGLWAKDRRHFAVLTGLSGTGKTLLAKSYAEAICNESGAESHLLTLPVQPGWHDPSALLGYVNPLQGKSYVRTTFLNFLISASKNPDRPFTVILEEMNLSRPEQYLAPILSAMETGGPLDFYPEADSFEGLPSKVPYPRNLAIIGTVNMDETTHGISDKVLDRAFTIEFWDVDLTKYPDWGKRERIKEYEGKIRELLTGLMESLQPARLHFGWRIVDDVLDYMERVMAYSNDTQDADEALAESLDDVVYAKVLPKLRGANSPRFLKALEMSKNVLRQHSLNTCVRKVEELEDDLRTTGSARFWR